MQYEQWTKGEKTVARRAYDLAFERECSALAAEVRRRAHSIADAGDVWRLHDYLTEQRRNIDEKYDYRYSVLVFVFARLMRDGWITEAELHGLSEDKLKKIRFMAQM